jgi:hypothetical protein
MYALVFFTKISQRISSVNVQQQQQHLQHKNHRKKGSKAGERGAAVIPQAFLWCKFSQRISLQFYFLSPSLFFFTKKGGEEEEEENQQRFMISLHFFRFYCYFCCKKKVSIQSFPHCKKNPSTDSTSAKGTCKRTNQQQQQQQQQ